MMSVLPVAGGTLPRPQGGRLTGLFLPEAGGLQLVRLGAGREVLACPWNVDQEALYPVGVVSRIIEVTVERARDEKNALFPVVLVTLEGREHARWHSLRMDGADMFLADVERLDLRADRRTYPVISGAGWRPEGGYTEFCGAADIPVTLYGVDLATGNEVGMTANLGGLVDREQAHTIEHAMIRALRVGALCTARTLFEAVQAETRELKQTVEWGVKYALPEVLGRTAGGVCGNVMTNMARSLLSRNMIDGISAGKSLSRALAEARRATMSRLTGDLGLTTQPGLRVLQGLKKGMSHDDTPLKLSVYKKVIARFPFDPWE